MVLALGAPERAVGDLESQWLVILGYFESIIGNSGAEWPVILGKLAFQAYMNEQAGHAGPCRLPSTFLGCQPEGHEWSTLRTREPR